MTKEEKLTRINKAKKKLYKIEKEAYECLAILKVLENCCAAGTFKDRFTNITSDPIKESEEAFKSYIYASYKAIDNGTTHINNGY